MFRRNMELITKDINQTFGGDKTFFCVKNTQDEINRRLETAE